MQPIHFQLSNKVLAYCQYFVYFFLITTTFSCCKVYQGKVFKITPCGTVHFKNDIQMIQSFYYAEYQTQVNTYFIYHADNFPALFEEAFCINSILPTSLFQHNTQLSNYLIEDSTAFLFCKSGKQDNVFLRVNNQGIITDTLYANFGLFAGKPLTFWSFMTLLPLPKTGENRNYVTYLGIVKENDYQRNLSTRLRLFSSHYLSEITVTKDSILLNHFEKYLNYPKNYLSKNMVYQSYWPSRVTLNKI